jgi:predicted dehydrogenase
MTLRWGLIAPGRIARRFADAFAVLPGHALHRVAARDVGKAQAFAAEWGGEASPSIEALCADPEVDIVYVASPHSHHAAHAGVALAAGKPVLCEKSLAPDRATAERLFALARERRVFLMEAVWSRFLPAWRRVQALLAQGAIGEVQRVQSSFCFAPPYDPSSRLFDPALAGGALLDIGVYNLNLTAWVMQLAGQGDLKDWDVAGAPDGFWHAQALRWQRKGEPIQVEAHPFARNGFEGEMQACA